MLNPIHVTDCDGNIHDTLIESFKPWASYLFDNGAKALEYYCCTDHLCNDKDYESLKQRSFRITRDEFYKIRRIYCEFHHINLLDEPEYGLCGHYSGQKEVRSIPEEERVSIKEEPVDDFGVHVNEHDVIDGARITGKIYCPFYDPVAASNVHRELIKLMDKIRNPDVLTEDEREQIKCKTAIKLGSVCFRGGFISKLSPLDCCKLKDGRELYSFWVEFQ